MGTLISFAVPRRVCKEDIRTRQAWVLSLVPSSSSSSAGVSKSFLLFSTPLPTPALLIPRSQLVLLLVAIVATNAFLSARNEMR